jgi:hypothetical protein
MHSQKTRAGVAFAFPAWPGAGDVLALSPVLALAAAALYLAPPPPLFARALGRFLTLPCAGVHPANARQRWRAPGPTWTRTRWTRTAARR